jgi:hypothetical protein
MNAEDPKNRRTAPLRTPTDLSSNATRDVAAALNLLLADVFALYIKTKNFHWHMSGPHFRDYHLLLDEQADQIFAMTDALAERVRKVGGNTLRSIGQSHGCSACWTMTRNLSRRWTCWPSSATTAGNWPPPCARLTPSAMKTAISPAPAL